VFGVQVDSLACTLYKPKFSDVESAEIYVDHDTRIAEDNAWTLLAPVKIVVEADQSIDILVDGSFSTVGESEYPGSGHVTIQSSGASPGSDDWNGIEFRSYSTGQLYDVVIGDAVNPISFIGAAFARVWDSTIENYEEVGILDYSSGSWIEDCDITAGAPSAGTGPEQIGVRLVDSSARVVGNSVGAQTHYGLKVEFDKDLCNAPLAADTLRILDNEITGPGETGVLGATGVHVSWGCESRHPRIRDNLIREWDGVGLDLVECEDVAATCNTLTDNRHGVRYSRTRPDGAPWVAFASNVVEKSDERNLRVDEGKGLILQDVSTGVGRNILRMESDQALNLEMNDTGLSSDLTAGDNNWVEPNGVPCQTAACAEATIDGDAAHLVDVGTVRTDLSTACSGGGGLATIQRPESALLDEVGRAAAAGNAVPVPENLTLIARSGTGGGVRIRYGLPADAARLSGRIYDVRGRAVRDLNLANRRAGWHEYVWAGENESGRHVASGVYFVRIEAGAEVRTEKVVVIR